MTDDAALQQQQAQRLLAAWRAPTGWRYLSAVNNTVVGLWYIAVTFAFFLFGGVLALLMRVQLARPDNDFLTAGQYNQIFTLHGSVMMFLFAIPIFESVSIMFLPAMVGARELPFPRVSAFGFWAFTIGGVFLCGSIFFGAAPQGGWFMYPPLSSRYQPGIGADIWLLGFSFIEVSAIAAAVELIVGVLKCRAPGMRLNLMPLYAWYVLVAGVMVVFAFPPLIAGSILLELERALGWPFFDPAGGGDPLLWQHLFWIFGHPEVYIIFLPSIALVAMIVPTAARRPMVGYSWVVLAAVGTGFLSFGLWVHHMFTTGLPGITLALFSAASMAVAIPTGVQLFCFIATLLAGTVVRSTAMLFVIGGLSTFVIGGLTGVMVALAPFNFQAHDSYFVVAHLHTVLIAGSVFPVVAGVYYYHPLALNKTLSERLGRIAFWLMFVGFNATFMPMHLTGLMGLPRRVFTYPPGAGLEGLNLLSTAGAFVLAAGVLVVVWDVLRPKTNQPAVRNPWNAGSVEWLQESPGLPWGLRSIPYVETRYPLWQQPNFVGDYDAGRFFLPDAEEGRREMLITSSIDAQPIQCMRIPGPTFVTLWAAAAVGGVFIFPTFKMYSLMFASIIASVITIGIWLWTGTGDIPEKESRAIGRGVTLPLYASGPQSAGWWAMGITLLAIFTAFICLVFGYFFYWTLDADFVPAGAHRHAVIAAGGLAASTVAWVSTVVARRSNAADRGRAFHIAAAIAIAASLVAMAGVLGHPYQLALEPRAGIYGAIVWLLAIWTAAHIAIGAVMLFYCMLRRVAGRLTAKYDMDIVNVELYWHFTVVTTAITVAVNAGFPFLV